MSPTCDIDVFWGEMSPCDHSVQIYQDDAVLLDALEGYVVGGLRNGHAAIVIATQSHLESLGNRLAARGVDLDVASSQDQYIALDAEQTLAEFMRDGWLDAGLFRECVHRIFKRSRAHDRTCARSEKWSRCCGHKVTMARRFVWSTSGTLCVKNKVLPSSVPIRRAVLPKTRRSRSEKFAQLTAECLARFTRDSPPRKNAGPSWRSFSRASTFMKPR
jgi:hypothetical protein